MTTRRSSSDAGIISQLIGLHYAKPPTLLDSTFGGGRMWRGCAYQPTTRFDARQLPCVDAVGEWVQLPDLFGAAAFRVVVFDPPHLSDGTRGAMGGTWDEMYGTGSAQMRGKLSINHLYEGFLEAARGVLTSDGMLLAKIADQVHGQVQQLQAVDFVIACRTAGWTVCEMVPKMRQPGPMDPKWRRQYHVRKAWSYWIATHPGPKCPAEGVPLLLPCGRAGCPREFRAEHRDSRYCSQACQKRVWRQNVRETRSVVEVLSRTSKGV